MFTAPMKTLSIHLRWTESAHAQDRQSSGLLTAPAAFVHAEHIPDLINKFDLVLHSISPVREYDKGHNKSHAAFFKY